MGVEIAVQCDAAKVKAGLKGNLIINVFAEKVDETAKKTNPAAPPRARRWACCRRCRSRSCRGTDRVDIRSASPRFSQATSGRG